MSLNKTLLALALGLALTACKSNPIIENHYIDKPVPVNAVPKPPALETIRPVYETSKLTPEDRKDIGIVSKAVAVELKQKDAYIGILELIINTYKGLSEKAVVHEDLVVPGVTDKPVQPTP